MTERTVGFANGLTNYGDRDFSLYLRRSFAKSMGYSDAMLARPVVGIASTPSGAGYWEVASDGGIFTFGDASYRGSTGGEALVAPVVGMSSPSQTGYWEVASDGGIFSFGLPFYGSMG